MPIKQWTIGDVPKLKVIFKNADTLLPMAPTVVTLTVKRPTGAAVVYTFGVEANLTSPVLGTYVYPLSLTLKGTYRWRWTGANGPNEGAADEGTLDAVTSI